MAPETRNSILSYLSDNFTQEFVDLNKSPVEWKDEIKRRELNDSTFLAGHFPASQIEPVTVSIRGGAGFYRERGTFKVYAITPKYTKNSLTARERIDLILTQLWKRFCSVRIDDTVTLGCEIVENDSFESIDKKTQFYSGSINVEFYRDITVRE